MTDLVALLQRSASSVCCERSVSHDAQLVSTPHLQLCRCAQERPVPAQPCRASTLPATQADRGQGLGSMVQGVGLAGVRLGSQGCMCRCAGSRACCGSFRAAARGGPEPPAAPQRQGAGRVPGADAAQVPPHPAAGLPHRRLRCGFADPQSRGAQPWCGSCESAYCGWAELVNVIRGRPRACTADSQQPSVKGSCKESPASAAGPTHRWLRRGWSTCQQIAEVAGVAGLFVNALLGWRLPQAAHLSLQLHLQLATALRMLPC